MLLLLGLYFILIQRLRNETRVKLREISTILRKQIETGKIHGIVSFVEIKFIKNIYYEHNFSVPKNVTLTSRRQQMVFPFGVYKVIRVCLCIQNVQERANKQTKHQVVGIIYRVFTITSIKKIYETFQTIIQTTHKKTELKLKCLEQQQNRKN